jgi:predicted site-specific integrase-resolvase
MTIAYGSSFLTSKKAMEILGVSIVTLRKWSKDKTINTIRTSGNHRLYDVKSYLREYNIEKDKSLIKNDIAKTNNDNNDNNDEKNNILKKIKRHSCQNINKEIKKINELSDLETDDEIVEENTNDEIKNINNNNNKQNICYIRISFPNQKNVLEKYREYMNKHFSKYTIIEDIGSGMDFNRPGFRKIMKLALDKKLENLVIVNKENFTSIGFEFIEYIIKKNSNAKIFNEKIIETNTKESTFDNIIDLIELYNKNI